MYIFHQAIIHLFISQLKVNPLFQLIISREKISNFLFSNSFQKGGFNFSSTSPTLELQTATASFQNKPIIQILVTGQMVIHNMLTAFPEI